MTIIEVNKKIQTFEGDKRSKEYRELKEQLEQLEDSNDVELEKYMSIDEEQELIEEVKQDTPKQIISEDIYETLQSFNGKIPGDKITWLFDTYNALFNEKIQKCLCPGKIRKMIYKIEANFKK